MKQYILLIVLAISSMLYSCSDDADFTTKVVERSQLSSVAGFAWFETFVFTYNPDATIVEEIKSLNKANYSYYFFAAPTCNCDTTQNFFPNAVKTLDDALVPQSATKFIAMKNISAENPFKANFKLRELPTIYLVKDNQPFYCISDTFRSRPKSTKIESVILDAIIEANK